MNDQPKQAQAPRKPAARKAYRKPEVRTQRPAEREVLAASTGCGNGFDESMGCDFAG